MFSFTRSRSRCRLRIKKIPGAAIKQAGSEIAIKQAGSEIAIKQAGSETLRQLPHKGIM